MHEDARQLQVAPYIYVMTSGRHTNLDDTVESSGVAAAHNFLDFELHIKPGAYSEVLEEQNRWAIHNLPVGRLEECTWEPHPTFASCLKSHVSDPLATNPGKLTDQSNRSTSNVSSSSSSNTPSPTSTAFSITRQRQTRSSHSHPGFCGPLYIIEYLGSGRLWDAYIAILEEYPGKPEVLLRICDTSTFEHMTEEEYDDGWYTPEEAQEHIDHEAHLYTNYLGDLVGTVVPRILGAALGTIETTPGCGKYSQYHVVVTEYCGESYAFDPESIDDLKHVSEEDKIAILSAYDRLHDHKVVHRDISGRHILRHPGNGQPRIIDLEGALWIGDFDKDTQTAMIRKEQEDVQRLVDLPMQ